MATFISLRSPMPSGFYGCLSLSLMIKKKNAAILIDNILQYKIAFSRARASRSSNTVYLRDKSNLTICKLSQLCSGHCDVTNSIYRDIDT